MTTTTRYTEFQMTRTANGYGIDLKGYGLALAVGDSAFRFTTETALARMADVFEGDPEDADKLAALRALAESSPAGAFAVCILAADCS